MLRSPTLPTGLSSSFFRTAPVRQQCGRVGYLSRPPRDFIRLRGRAEPLRRRHHEERRPPSIIGKQPGDHDGAPRAQHLNGRRSTSSETFSNPKRVTASEFLITVGRRARSTTPSAWHRARSTTGFTTTYPPRAPLPPVTSHSRLTFIRFKAYELLHTALAARLDA